MTKKILFILMPKDYRDEEFTIPYNTLCNKYKKENVDVASFNLEGKEAIGGLGHKHTPNLKLSKLTHSDFDKYNALVIPGGKGSTTYIWGNKEIQKIIQYFHSKNKIVAAICYGSMAVAESGIVKGKKATIFPTDEAKNKYKTLGVEFTNEPVVVSEKTITAQGPAQATDFANKIIELIEKE